MAYDYFSKSKEADAVLKRIPKVLKRRPKNLEEKKIIKMRDRLAFDEALSHQIKLFVLKEKIKKNKCNKIETNKSIKKEII